MKDLIKYKGKELSESLLEAMYSIVLILDPNGKIVFYNKYMEKLSGHKLKDMKGKDWFSNFLPKQDYNKVRRIFKKAIATERTRGNVNLIVTKKGEERLIKWYDSLIEDNNGKIEALLVVGYDVTEEIEVQEKYKDLVENINDVIFSLDTRGVITYISPTLEKISGWKPEEVVGSKFIKFIHKDYIKDIEKRFKGVKKGIIKSTEWKFLTKKGDYKWMRVSSKLDKKARGITGVLVDVSEKKEIEDKLKESETRFQDIALSSADWIWETDAKGKYTFVAGNVKNILGYKPEELIGKTSFDLMPKDEAEKVGKEFQKIVSQKKKIVNLENWNLTKNKQRVCLLTSGVPVLDKKGNLEGYRGVDRDITKEKEIAKELKEEEERYKALFAGSRDAIMILEPPTWKFTSGNEAALKLFGAKDEAVFIKLGPQNVSPKNQPDGQLSSKGAKFNIAKTMKEGSYFFRWIHQTVDGKEFPATVLLSKIKVAGKEMLQATVRDISEERKIEGQLREKVGELEKMNRLMIGRELKMVKLKEEIERLKSK